MILRRLLRRVRDPPPPDYTRDIIPNHLSPFNVYLVVGSGSAPYRWITGWRSGVQLDQKR